MQYHELTVGQWAEVSRTITEADLVLYAGITGDTNPLHVNAEWSANSRFGGRIAHGLLTAGLLSTVLGTRLPGAGAVYLNQTLAFRRPVYPGDTITARAEVVELLVEKRQVRLATRISNHKGDVVLEGEALMLVDDRPDPWPVGGAAVEADVPRTEVHAAVVLEGLVRWE